MICLCVLNVLRCWWLGGVVGLLILVRLGIWIWYLVMVSGMMWSGGLGKWWYFVWFDGWFICCVLVWLGWCVFVGGCIVCYVIWCDIVLLCVEIWCFNMLYYVILWFLVSWLLYNFLINGRFLLGKVLFCNLWFFVDWYCIMLLWFFDKKGFIYWLKWGDMNIILIICCVCWIVFVLGFMLLVVVVVVVFVLLNIVDVVGNL